MKRWVINWALSVLGLWIVSVLLPGIHLKGVGPAILAVLVIGLVNSTLGMVLKIITFPITFLTLGLFWFVINAFMLELAAALAPGFAVAGFGWAFIGAIVLSLANLVLRSLVND
jgi:putative membrane protein